MGIEQHSEIALGGRLDQLLVISDNFNRSFYQSVANLLRNGSLRLTLGSKISSFAESPFCQWLK